MEKEDVVFGLIALEGWLSDRGWKLHTAYKCVDMVDFDAKKVSCSTRGKPEHVLYSVLHECGHIIAGGKKATLELRGAPPSAKRTLYYRIATVVHESRAWDAGEKLASRLGIAYSCSNYAKYRAIYLHRYFIWAAQGKKSRFHVTTQYI